MFFEPVLHASRELLQTGFRKLTNYETLCSISDVALSCQDPGGEVGPI